MQINKWMDKKAEGLAYVLYSSRDDEQQPSQATQH
jgi:hypothetical protein